MKPGDMAQLDLTEPDEDTRPYEYGLFESPDSTAAAYTAVAVPDKSMCLVIATYEDKWAFCLFPQAPGWTETKYLHEVNA